MGSKPANNGSAKKGEPTAASARKRSSTKKAATRETAATLKSTRNDRWVVTVVRESVDEATLYVAGRTRDQAAAAADDEFLNGNVYDFITIYSEYSLEVERLDPRHEVTPVGGDGGGMVCKMCLRSVSWTGIAADDSANRSGKTIPGPWVHVQE